MMGDTMTMREWLTDGWVYVETEVDGETVRTKTQVDLAEQLALIQQAQASASMDMVNVSGLAMVDSITTRTQGTNTVYTLVISGPSMNSMMSTAFSAMLGSDLLPAEDLQAMMEMLSFDDITAVYTSGPQRRSEGHPDDLRHGDDRPRRGGCRAHGHDHGLRHDHDRQRHRRQRPHHLPQLLQL